MSLRQQLQDTHTLILNGRLEDAAAELNRLQPADTGDLRMKAHLEAMIAFHRGEIEDAYEQMQEALEKYGDNVNLWRDVAVCQYHLQDMLSFRTTLARLETMLVEHEAKLCPRSLIECEILLGKFLEEEARLAPALHFYDRALMRAEVPAHRVRALLLKARWLALYEPNQELSNYYRDLISVPPERITKDLKVELEHALMLIELRLIGGDHAWQRIEKLGDSILPIDQRLMVFDFIEGCLSQDYEINPSVLKKANEFTDLDPFENFLRMILKGSLEQKDLLRELTELAPKLPWASYLRILCIAANLDKNAAVRQELHRKIQLIVRALDPRSQALWTQRLKESLQSDEIRMDFSARNRCITVQGKVVDLTKKKIGLQLLEGLVQKPTMSVDEAIELLWQSSFSPEHYHRLRMSIHRLNTLIHEVVGLGKVVEVDSQNVRLRPEVRLRQAEEAFDMGLIGL